MTKDIQMKKRLIRDIALVATGVVMLSGTGFLLAGYDDDVQSKKMTKESDNSSTRSERDRMQQKWGAGSEVNEYYNTYKLHHNTNFLLNRELATQWLTELRSQHHLVNMEVTIAPVSDVTNNEFRLASGTMVKSEVSVSFGALTDNSVYNFIEALQRRFPGIILVSELKLARTGDVTRGVLTDLSQHKLSSLVKGSISFVWLGIRPKPDEKPANSHAPAGGPGNVN